ncbi:MAG: CRISPR-associated endonuclease Cas3'' [Planctomycetota bacterium]|nr:CRISPR-associated endonuclease Cas3'' [Planctomycetota bacterium]
MQTYSDWFHSVTCQKTHPWQLDLANDPDCRNRLIRIPTGMGKTLGVFLAWLRHRVQLHDLNWPCRLVWCLPMRTLVEQTADAYREVLEKLGLLWDGTSEHDGKVGVHVLMGGIDSGEWHLYPECPAVLIGTQDMLLSRALNRGYGCGRARWPMEFGLLHSDSLWVMDEVQLMDVGLATSAQLQAFRDQDGPKGLRPCHTWWMSATLRPDWLKSVDTANRYPDWIRDLCFVPSVQRCGGLWAVTKELATDAIDEKDAKGFAQRILTEHGSTLAGEYGRITLVVCNTVARACATHDALMAAGRSKGIELVHSRFRPAEREDWRERFLSRISCTPDADRIIVATQVVEAGVDISAGCLITELAPWPSLVQRFGRCARYGGNGRAVVIDRGRAEKIVLPYSPNELESAWESLQVLRDVGIGSLEAYEESLEPAASAKLYPYNPSHLLLRREFDELFDTTPDLTGADLDISRFIRSGDERDLQVFWLEVEKNQSPSPDRQPQRNELCAVPFLKEARNWLCGEETKTGRKPKLIDRMRKRVWVWDWLDGDWIEATRASLLPGRIVCVAAACGGYQPQRGFDPMSRNPVRPVPPASIPDDVQALGQADDQQDGEAMSVHDWKTIACHSTELSDALDKMTESLGLPQELRKVLMLTGRWHDLGKAHPAFQGAILDSARPDRADLAKAPKLAWLRPPGTYRFRDGSDTRPGFRHELASAMALFAVLEHYAPQHAALLGPWSKVMAAMGNQPAVAAPSNNPTPCVQDVLGCSAEDFDLLVYLVASHHGKVRVALHASPKDQDYRVHDGRGLPIRGVREGDRLPPVVIAPDSPPLPELALTLEPAILGLSARTGASWRERCQGLIDRYGPAALAYMEALLRAADVRASRLKTGDPALPLEVSK